MKRVLDTSEVLGLVETPQGQCEVCAAADAQYDESAGRVVISLRAFLRNTDICAKEQVRTVDWLPAPETLREGGDPGEAGEIAREVFQRWVRKVRDAVPTLSHH